MSAPSDVHVRRLSTTVVEVTWHPPAFHGVAGYRVEYGAMTDDDDQQRPRFLDTGPYTVAQVIVTTVVVIIVFIVILILFIVITSLSTLTTDEIATFCCANARHMRILQIDNKSNEYYVLFNCLDIIEYFFTRQPVA